MASASALHILVKTEKEAFAMVKAFDDVVFKKEVLKVHGPVKTRFGYHLIKTLYRN